MITFMMKVNGGLPPPAPPPAPRPSCATQLSGRDAMPKRSWWSANLKKSSATCPPRRRGSWL
jgi:hypothetical protein